MKRTPFRSARLKAKRAKKHINEFICAADAFAATDFYRFFADHQPNGWGFIFDTDPLPDDFALIAGDAVICIRSALDHVATQIVREHTGKSNIQATFPMHKGRKNLVNMLKESPVKNAFPDIEGLILDEIKPTKCGNTLLWSAGKLAGLDKHRQLLITFGMSEIFIERIIDKENQSSVEGMRYLVCNGGPVIPFLFKGRPEIEGKTSATLEILFGPMFGLDKTPVVPTLVEMLERATNAIDAIEAEYLK